MWRILLLIVTGTMVSSVEMNCGNLKSPVGIVDTLYINSRDTVYRIDTVLLKNSYDTVYRFDTVFSKSTLYSKDTVFVETLLVNRSLYIDTAGNEYSKVLAFKGGVGDLPFEVDSVIIKYKIRTLNGPMFGHYDTSAFWYTAVETPGQVVDTVDTGTTTYGYYTLNTEVPIDDNWIILKASFSGSSAYMQKGDQSSYSMSSSSVRIYYQISSWLQEVATPARNPGFYEFVIVCPVK